MDDHMMNDQMMAQYANHQDMAIFTSIIIAVVAVGFINGGFAVLFSMRRILADGHGASSIKKTSMKQAATSEAAKSEAKASTQKSASRKTADLKKGEDAPTPMKPKTKAKKAKKASPKAKKKT